MARGPDYEKSPWLPSSRRASNPYLGKLTQMKVAKILLKIILFNMKTEQMSSKDSLLCFNSLSRISHGSLVGNLKIPLGVFERTQTTLCLHW